MTPEIPIRLQIFSVVPSPYQRDLFRTLAQRSDLDLEVAYLESAAPDSPWATEKLATWESVLPGFSLGSGRVRCHVNWGLELGKTADVTIINTPTTALTTQRLLRTSFPGRRLFWGEELLPAGGGVKAKLQRLLREPIGRCDGILAVGERAVAQYEMDFPETRIENLPYHCDLSAFSSSSEREYYSKAPVTFLFCGQMIERKGIDALLKAFDQATNEHGMDARMVLAGRPAEEDAWLQSMSEESRNRVEVVGFVQPEDLPELFARADVFVLPSRHDGWGVVVNQAIGAGLPILASRGVGAALDLVEEGKNGHLLPVGDVAALATAMAKLANSRKTINDYGVASRERASRITPEAGAEVLAKILHELCE